MRFVVRVVVVVLVVGVVGVLVPSVVWADGVRDDQWMVDALDLERVHGQVTEGAGTRIGLVDSGVDADHPDLEGNVEKGLTTWATGDGRQDNMGHGTAMASLLVGHGHGKDGGDGVVGVAPEASVVPVSVYPKGYADDPDLLSGSDKVYEGITEGVRWLADEAKVDVIVMAFTLSPSKRVANAIEHAAGKDIPMFAPTGSNQGTDNIGDSHLVQAPALDPDVEAVAGTNQDGEQWEGSNYGRGTMISAPATDIVTAAPGGKYKTDTGTSNSTAIAAGAAALMDSQWPDMDKGVIQWRLTETATDAGKKGPDSRTGYGIVNPYEALTATVEVPEELVEGDTKEEYNPEPNPRPSASDKAAASGSNNGGVPVGLWWTGGALAAAAVIVIMVMKRRTTTAPAPAPAPAGMFPPPHNNPDNHQPPPPHNNPDNHQPPPPHNHQPPPPHNNPHNHQPPPPQY